MHRELHPTHRHSPLSKHAARAYRCWVVCALRLLLLLLLLLLPRRHARCLLPSPLGPYLRRYINAYFKGLIEGIFMHAGDVIKFAGDALQVVWRNRRGSTDSLAQLVYRASRCCLDLLNRLNNFSPVEGVVLKLHMGVGAGVLSSFYVGGHANKWEYFVAGEPIEQMSDATEEATHGQLVLSTHAYDILSGDEALVRKYALQGSVLPSTQFLLEAMPPSEGAPPG